MIRHPFGRGEVFVLTLYPDWSYGRGQSSADERALMRDLVTYSLATPNSILIAQAPEVRRSASIRRKIVAGLAGFTVQLRIEQELAEMKASINALMWAGD